ncbi:uncharacterized protein ATNIH1004_003827 [Aspergillus tanneri]|uniref:Methyltransferase domain-containing protein n=1 Tax=Aspergillus tanneri TaxID=1220188 RepID=A0A5M9MLR1_9EURO|nr:uncharacterized protein ATNIH1004_003827 [Aspergillus tanneri]KAA8647945.1 hypothetical protein ATNIH1004_003827 [Aspergillus tanneri]
MAILGKILRWAIRIFRSVIGVDEKKLYGLDHSILHMEVPPTSMWMNMGYWKHTNSFPDACEALLDQVLITADLLSESRTPGAPSTLTVSSSTRSSRFEARHELQRENKIKLVDVGIGCGDQALYLTRRLSRPACHSHTGLSFTDTECAPGESEDMERPRLVESGSLPLFDSYVGITIAQSQADVARERLLKRNPSGNGSPEWTPEIRIFAADAARPALWGQELRDIVVDDKNRGPQITNKHRTGYAETCGSKKEKWQTWLLALDTLYHFEPSRKPLLRCAYRDMRASFMAFDLIISDRATFWEKLILRSICLVTGIPYSNFLSRKEYENMLVEAGYDCNMIVMRDITEYVFKGIAGYIWSKDRELRRYGMHVGKFRGPAKVFDWWADSGAVRGFVIVARWSENQK